MLDDRIHWDFGYHKPDAAKTEAHEQVRAACKALALYISHQVPEGREQSMAITKVEEAMFWANAALARDPRP